jgi:hypothetical protein
LRLFAFLAPRRERMSREEFKRRLKQRVPKNLLWQQAHKKPYDKKLPVISVAGMSAEMAADYRIFKAAGLLSEWRIKWAAHLPTPD